MTLKNLYLVLLFCFAFTIGAKATHVLGGNIYYEKISPTQYHVTAKLWRDCNGVTMGNIQSIQVKSGVNATVYSNVNLVRTSVTTLDNLCSSIVNRCTSGTGTYGVEEHVYEGNVTINPAWTSLEFAISLCCHTNAITSMIAPGGENIFIATKVMDLTVPVNSSPRFIVDPIFFSPTSPSNAYSHSHLALDPDGDSLSYAFIPAYEAFNDVVEYTAGYSVAVPFGGGTITTINPTNGSVDFAGNYNNRYAAYVVQVTEWRNGVILSQVSREIATLFKSPNNQQQTINDFANHPGSTLNFNCGTGIETDTLIISDLDPTDLIYAQLNSTLPGISIQPFVPANPLQLIISFDLSQFQPGTYQFQVQSDDNRCPFPLSKSRIFTINVGNTAPANIDCPNDTTLYLNASCQRVLPDFRPLAVYSNCGLQSVTQTPPPGTLISTNTVVQLVEQKLNGTSDTCTFNVFVSDTTRPSISCLGNQTGYLTATCDFTLPDYTTGIIINDNCGTAGLVLTQTPVAGTVITANQVVTMQVVDPSGNTSSCQFTVNVMDTIAPVLTAIPNDTIFLDANCQAIVPDYSTQANAQDNCSIQSETQTPTAGTIITGATTVTYSAVSNGQTTTISFQLTPLDSIAPVVTCPTNTNVYLNATCSYTIPDYALTTIPTDNCTSVLTTVQTPVAGTVISAAQTVTYTVSDAAGNTTTCAFTLTPIDTIAPSITCLSNQTGYLTTTCDFTLPDYTTGITINDNCGTAGLVLTQTPVAGTVITTNQVVTMQVVDPSGNTSSCQFTVNVMDTIAPVLTAIPNDTIFLDANCQAIVPDYSTQANAQDNCSIQSETQTPAAGTIITGATTVTYSAVSNGQTTTISFQLTPLDSIAPVVTCPTNTNVYLNATCSYTIPDYALTTVATDNCTSVLTSVQTPVAGTVISAAQTVTYTVSDAAGNTTTCAFTLTPIDTIAPSITCLSNQTGYLTASCDFTLPDYTAGIIINDNCGTAGLVLTQTPVAGTVITANQVVTMQVTDANGNATSCQFNVQVADTISPFFAPMNNIVSCVPLVTYPAPLVIDNCGLASVTQVSGLPSGVNYPIGVTVNSFEAVDVNGNVSIVSFTVEIFPTPVIAVATTLPTCGQANGSIDVTVSNGQLPYQYNWNTGATTDDLTGLIGGTYTITVVDDNGCSMDSTINLIVPNALSLALVAAPLNCFNDNNGTIASAVNGGLAPYSYSWSNGATSPNLTSVSAGVYTLTLTDDAGCTISETVTVSEPNALSANVQVSDYFGQTLSSFDACDGSIVVQVVGGTSPYEYTMNGNAAGPVNSNLCQGIYTLTITDDNGCQFTFEREMKGIRPVKVPQGISPNGDMENDLLVIEGLEFYPDHLLRIYNRWGDMIFEAKNYQNDWNGVNQFGPSDGIPIEGSYFYELKLDEEQAIQTGYIVIKK